MPPFELRWKTIIFPFGCCSALRAFPLCAGLVLVELVVTR